MKRGKRILHYFILSVLIINSFSSCTNDEYDKQEAAIIQQYLDENPTLIFDLKPSGLYYHEIKTGTGVPATFYDTVSVLYSTKFLDGRLIESNVSSGNPLIFPLGEDYFIKGLEEGITYMKEGGKALFLIPSKLAYGSYGNYYRTIPGHTPLLFEIELIKVKPGPVKK